MGTVFFALTTLELFLALILSKTLLLLLADISSFIMLSPVRTASDGRARRVCCPGQVLDLVKMCWFCEGHKTNFFVILAGCFRCTYVNTFTWEQFLVYIYVIKRVIFSFPISAKFNFASERYFMYQFWTWLKLTRIKSGLSVIIMFIISNAYIITLEKK